MKRGEKSLGKIIKRKRGLKGGKRSERRIGSVVERRKGGKVRKEKIKRRRRL